MSDCLTDDQVERHVVGSATPEEREALEAHIQACSACSARVENHLAKEGLLAEARQVYESAGSLAEFSVPTAEEIVPGYRILEEVHRGGQGVVYKAIQQSTEREVAVKMLHAGALASETARARFQREIKLAAKLYHPHIVAIHDSGVADGCPYIVMDYLPGLRLTDYAAARGLSIADKIHLFATICDAVEYAHQHNVIHRDLKPSNILVSEEGEPVIVDFGLARPLEAGEKGASITNISSPGQLVGSLLYLSPEQAIGDWSQIDERTDIYALGVLLYEMLTGTLPPPVSVSSQSRAISPASSSSTHPIPPSRAFVGLDHRLDRIVLKAIEYDKHRRYRSAGDFATVVRTYLDHPARGVSSTRRRVLWVAGVAVLLIYGFVATISWKQAYDESKGLSDGLAETQAALDEALKRPPIPDDPPRYPQGDEIYGIPITWQSDYHGHVDTTLLFDNFDAYRFGQNPPLFNLDTDTSSSGTSKPAFWEHFEGVNVPGSEGQSNLYITGFWRHSPVKALRARTGIWRSSRVSALNVWEYIKDADRFYYQCWLHLAKGAGTNASLGFVSDHPLFKIPTNWVHAWVNCISFQPGGVVLWSSYRGAAREVFKWSPGEEFACFLRVELDFNKGAGNVYINGELLGENLPITEKTFELADAPGRVLRLDRWGFASPGVSRQRVYEPLYADIDDLEFGTWE